MPIRRRAKTPGVSVFRREVKGQKIWCADITNPEDGSRSRISLRENYDIKTADEAYDWAKEKAKELEDRRKAVDKGTIHKTAASSSIETLINDYVAARKSDLSPRTLQDRTKRSFPQFLAWAEEAGIKNVRDLNRKALVDFRTWLQNRKRKKVLAGGKRKTPKTVTINKPRDAVTLNNCLTDIKAILNWARTSGYSHLDSDAIRDSLAPFKRTKKHKRWLKSEEMQALVQAAKELDAEKMTITRKSKAAGKEWDGEFPPKYEPVLPILLLLLLGGFRKAELENLRWSDVDFKNGTIKIGFYEHSEWRPKTNEERYITLKESPLLEKLLKKMHDERGDSAYVLGGKKPKIIRKDQWQRLLDQAKLSGIRIKDCRSTCATYLICSRTFGGVPHLIASRMGHSVETLFKHYAGLNRTLTGLPTLEEEMGIADALGPLKKKTDPKPKKSKNAPPPSDTTENP